jgi:hypothetical protein
MVTVWPATVSVPLRPEPVLACTEYVTVPLPVSEPPLATVTQLTLLFAVHEHTDDVVTLIAVPLPPAAPTDTVVGETANAHAAAACVTVTVRPATASVPVRSGPVLLEALKETDPSPEPFAPDVTVSHDELLVAVHVHPVSAVTVILPFPPEVWKFCSVGATSKRHAAASCRICARTPLTRTSPCLATAAGLAATVIRTSPAPWPDAGVIPVIQFASDEAFHVHSG